MHFTFNAHSFVFGEMRQFWFPDRVDVEADVV
jgi:hypothetical protein